MRDIEILFPEHSRSSHLQCPIPHPSCCPSLLMALAAESPDLCTIFLLTFPLGIDLRITSFFCPFHPFRACPDLLNLSSCAVPESDSGLSQAPSLKLWQGFLGCSQLRCLDYSTASCTGRLPSNPNQWSITCQSQRWMPPPLAVTILHPAACIPSMSLAHSCLIFSFSSNRQQCCPQSLGEDTQ